ncbi:MAG: hypothetical protein LBH75_04640 [Treponema sp.]|jgi:hypothetical protein|nr:hypothetical protein [Treponema sp.]
MNISESRERFIFRAKIDLGDGEYILFREPFINEVYEIRRLKMGDDEASTGNENEGSLKVISNIFENCIIGSSFTLDDGKPAPTDQVLALLKDSGSLYMKAFQGWQESLPLAYRAPKEQASETSTK